jgi:hypothetical protein
MQRRNSNRYLYDITSKSIGKLFYVVIIYKCSFCGRLSDGRLGLGRHDRGNENADAPSHSRMNGPFETASLASLPFGI